MTFALAEATMPAPEEAVPAARRAPVSADYGQLPLTFEPNRGQSDPRVKFLARGPGYTLFLTPSEAVLRLQGQAPAPEGAVHRPAQRQVSRVTQAAALPSPHAGETTSTPSPQVGETITVPSPRAGEDRGEGAVLRMKLLGTNAQTTLSGVDPLPGKVNYLRGQDPTQWRTNIPTYAKVSYDVSSQ
jgi:hypothetical protein